MGIAAGIVFGSAAPAFADLWYEHYDRGKTEAESGSRANWTLVEEQMLAAKRLRPKQGRSELFYGTIRRPYIPDYYLALASYQLGKAQAPDLLAGVKSAGLVRASDPEWNELNRYTQLAQQRMASGPTAPPPSLPPPVPSPEPTPTVPSPIPSRVPPSAAPSPTVTPRPSPTASPSPAAADIARALAQARSHLGNKRYAQARERVEAARAAGASPQDVAALLRSVDVAEALEGLRAVVSASKWPEARTLADRVAQLDPSNTDLPPLRSRIDDAFRRQPSQALRDALRTYYAGDYQGALQKFEDILRAQPDAVRAHFYVACSHVALALTGQGDRIERLAKAREAFARARNGLAELSPDRQFVSPRIIDILEGRVAAS